MSTPLPVPDGPRRAGGPPPPVDFDQEPADVLQETDGAYDIKAVPVCVEDSVRVQELPARSGACWSTVASTAGVRVLGRDPRRKSATLIALTEDVRLGTTQANAIAGARIPAVVPFVVSHIDEVWAASVQNTTEISVITEQWAD